MLLAGSASCLAQQIWAVQPEVIIVSAHVRLVFDSDMMQLRGLLSLQFKSSSCLAVSGRD